MFKIIFCEEIATKKIFNENDIGLTLINEKDSLKIYSDPFKSKTLYFLKTKNKFYLTSKTNYFLENEQIYKFLTVDKVAFNETLIFGTPFLERTIYKQIKQLPGGSYIEINKLTGKYKIKKYFNFNIYTNNEIRTIKKAVDLLHQNLIEEFKKINSDKQYIMGISGGLDSRLTLSLLSNLIPKEQINLFTFGYDKRILEYQSAQKVAKELGYETVFFHRLTSSDYNEAFEYLPKESLGQISIDNCHITSFLRYLNKNNFIQISNYFSDAIFGYSTYAPKVKFDLNNNSYFYELEKNNLEEDINIQIRQDIENLCAGFDPDSNYSSINEYLYLTERNSKFHLNLASCQSSYNKTICPYASVNLFKFLISLPIEYRHQKRIIDEYFNLINPNLSNKNIYTISSRFSSNNGGYNNFLYFRALNLSNAIFRKLNINYQFLNIYQTENQEYILKWHLRKKLKEAINNFYERGLISNKQREEYSKSPLRSKGMNQLFNLISLNSLINS